MKPNILLISPQAEICEPLKTVLEKEGFAVKVTDLLFASSRSPLTAQFSLVILIWPRFDDGRENSAAEPPTVDALFLTGNQEALGAVQTYQNGVYSFETNQTDAGRFAGIVKEMLLQTHAVRIPPAPILAKAQPEDEKLNLESLIGQSPQMEAVRQQIKRLSQFPGVPVLITGETGTGKELVVDLLHHLSSRANRTLIKVNCSALPDALFESQLFGHRKGAFTGALTAHKGFAEAAQDGTLFLDEISTLKLELQPKLLRLLENGSYLPVGETMERRTNARIIAATNQKLEEVLEKKSFREDLYYRLKCSEIKLTPLRERPQDIILLANHFLLQFSLEYGLEPKILSSEVKAMVTKYHWPGNVRELKNVMQAAIIKMQDQQVLESRFFAEFLHKNSKTTKTLPESTALHDAEKLHIMKILEQSQGNLRQTARLLGIDRNTLLRKIRKYAIDVDAFRSHSPSHFSQTRFSKHPTLRIHQVDSKALRSKSSLAR